MVLMERLPSSERDAVGLSEARRLGGNRKCQAFYRRGDPVVNKQGAD